MMAGKPLRRHQYVTIILVGLGAVIWGGTFDAVGSRNSGAGIDQDLYVAVIRWSAVGAILSLAGLVAAFRCREKLLRAAAVLIGAASAIMCAANIIVPP